MITTLPRETEAEKGGWRVKETRKEREREGERWIKKTGWKGGGASAFLR